MASAFPSAPPGAAPGFLRPYLRALWQQAPAVMALPTSSASPSARAVLGDGLLLVPPFDGPATPTRRRALRLATAAHAGAHVKFRRGPFERGALKPVQAVLLELLEDARVECLAAAELPGLRALWLGLHPREATGLDFEALLQRLSRSLLEPGHVDPHPWVRKARCMFFVDADGTRMADLGPQAMRHAASLLGNDIGQMRLQFNARSYVVEPAYRDDNSHLWLDGPQAPAKLPDALTAPPAERGTHSPAGTSPTAAYPEWDRLIGRLRCNWVTVHERDTTNLLQDGGQAQCLREALVRHAAAARHLRRLLAAEADPLSPSHRRRAGDGDDFHLDALVEARIAQRIRANLPARICLRSSRRLQDASIVIVLDASASTARACGAHGESVLQAARIAALLLACALEAEGHECAVQAFSSNGRNQVVVQPVKDFAQACNDDAVYRRAAALRSRWSTRIGAAVRHAAAAAGRRRAHRALVLLVTDGEPYDIDVHDPRYLVEDLRHAVRESARCGVHVACVNFEPTAAGRNGGTPLRSAFAPGAYRCAAGVEDFPACALAALRHA